jgi:MoaA/NifB/PqqE/SkfB family radical SAM enzyme
MSGAVNALDKYKMDSNKMLWHLENVAKWQKGENVAPIHIDMGLSKGCNQHCVFCYGMFQGNEFKKGYEIHFSGEPLFNFLRDAAELGVKSIGFIGEGEPLVNPDVYKAVRVAKDSGIDVAMATNGEMLDHSEALGILERLTYLRFNVSAGTERGYRRIHKVAEGVFEKVLDNVSKCVELKKQHKLDVTIGLQMVLMPQNIDEVVPLAKLGVKLGVDYLVVKHCSDSPDRTLNIDHTKYLEHISVFKEAESYSNENYDVIIKWSKLTNEGSKCYDKCQAVPFFMMRVTCDGKLFPCAQFFDHRADEFMIADLTKERFKEAMFGARYHEVVRNIQALNVHKECMTNCKENSINEFLWLITNNKPRHINFV